MKIMGIDPGKSGVAVITDSINCDLTFYKFIFDKTNIINFDGFKEFIEKNKPDHTIIEKVMGRGGWGATQIFSFGFITAQIITVLRMTNPMPWEMATPQAWQAVMHKGVESSLKPKERSQIAYDRMFPSKPLAKCGTTKKRLDNNLLDAFLISVYGQLKFSKITNLNFDLKGDDNVSDSNLSSECHKSSDYCC